MLIVVLWVAFGLVSLALYFADAMAFELRASDGAACGLAADQAVEGAARYVAAVLGTYATNGVVPDLTQYQAAAVPVGDARFWIIGRDPSGAAATEPRFALVDEASKLNLNTVSTNVLLNVPNMTSDFALAIVDWRGAGGTGLSSLNYAQLGYLPKHAPFESVDELRLVVGSGIALLTGGDLNRNGVIDASEVSAGVSTGVSATPGESFTPGLFDLCTTFSREPNMTAAVTRTNVNTRPLLQAALQARFGAARAGQILSRLTTRSGGGPGRRPSTTRPATFTSPLRFYLQSGMTSQEFAQIADSLTVSASPYIAGRVNVNTAGATVLSCLPGLDLPTALQLVAYRTQNPGNLGSIAWIVDALGAGSTAVQSLAQGDLITTRSYQFAADVAAVGPHGRGYRRTRLLFDTSTGTVRVIYREDLGRLGWALGPALAAAATEHATR